MKKINNFMENYIKNKLADKIGEDKVLKLELLMDEIDKKQNSTGKKGGIFLWILLCIVLTIVISLTYFRGIDGFIASIFLSISVFVVGFPGRRLYCEMMVYPGGISGFYNAQNFIRKHSHEGPLLHKAIRSNWMRSWALFIYSPNSERWSWRPYALLCGLAVLIYFNPLIGFACLSMFLSTAFTMFTDVGYTPLALYLGSSSASSKATLKKIIEISGVRWISLLNDNIHEKDFTGNNAEAIFNAIDIFIRSNCWSLRCDKDNKWRKIVRDFMYASSIIVVRPESFGPVREEIKFLSTLDSLERVFVINSYINCDLQIPSSLKKYLIDENEAMDLLSLTASKPRLYRKQIKNRILAEEGR